MDEKIDKLLPYIFLFVFFGYLIFIFLTGSNV